MSGRRRPTRQRRADLSQHYLRDPVAQRLVHATSITSADLVIEIGPGRGALTHPLTRCAGRVIGVEADAYHADKLQRRFGDKARFVTGDFLNYALPNEPYLCLGNVPYAITTDIIRKLHTAPVPPLDAWLVVQRELAYRFCGPPFTNESLWSLRLKPFWHLEIVDRLQRTDFDPPPSVESVYMHFARRTRPLITPEQADAYARLLTRAFAQNQSISQALRSMLSKRQIHRLATDFCFSPQHRPSELMFEQWLAIFRFVHAQAQARRDTP